jgi:hypothetical protein
LALGWTIATMACAYASVIGSDKYHGAVCLSRGFHSRHQLTYLLIGFGYSIEILRGAVAKFMPSVVHII